MTKKPRRFRRFLFRLFLLLVIPSVAVFVGLAFYYSGGRYVTTENAYVKAPILAIASEVSGRVAKVYVQENQVIEPGQKLVALEGLQFELALREAEAELASVGHDIENRRAELRQARAEIEVAQERRRFLQSQYVREQKLTDKGIGRGTKLDEARHLLRAADRLLGAARQREGGILAKLGGSADIATADHPLHIAAVARLNRAKLDLDRSVLISNIGGIIAKMNLEAGEYIESGDVIFAVVQANKSWIEVNLKETELTYVRIGQRVTFVAEAYPDVKWSAKIASISPATGAEFAVLPPQNASGNWVKVVQRLPVRLAIDQVTDTDRPPLRAGMSVSVKIDTGHKRDAPAIISRVLAATRKFVGSSTDQ